MEKKNKCYNYYTNYDKLMEKKLFMEVYDLSVDEKIFEEEPEDAFYLIHIIQIQFILTII